MLSPEPTLFDDQSCAYISFFLTVDLAVLFTAQLRFPMSLMAALNDVSGPKKELLVHRVDHLAHTNPDALFAEFPVLSNSYDNGFHKVTYSILANAVNAVAWWLEATLGRGKSFETLAYVGPNDLRYTAFTLGAVKTGYLVRLYQIWVLYKNRARLTLCIDALCMPAQPRGSSGKSLYVTQMQNSFVG